MTDHLSLDQLAEQAATLRKYLDSFNEQRNDYRARVLALACAKELPALLAATQDLREQLEQAETDTAKTVQAWAAAADERDANRSRITELEQQLAQVTQGMRELRDGITLARLSAEADEATIVAQREELETLRASRRPPRFDCETCGPGIAVDEDGCCLSCGADASVVVREPATCTPTKSEAKA